MDRDRTNVLITFGTETFKIKMANQPTQRHASTTSTTTADKAYTKFKKPTLNESPAPQFGRNFALQ